MKFRYLATGAAAVALALASLAPSDQAVAAPAQPSVAMTPDLGRSGQARLIPTVIHAHQGTINLTNGGNLENISANLEDTAGNPIEGQNIRFVDAGGHMLGIARTNSDGDAYLSGAPLNISPNLLQQLTGGYSAVFSGGDGYARSSSHAAITIGDECGM